MKKYSALKISKYANYVALAFIFSYIESLIPFSLGIPGAKLGFANIITVYVLYMTKSVKDTFMVVILRVVLTAFTFGNLSTMMYSICGSLLSTLVMFLLYKTNLFTVFGVSIAGGVFHNAGQLICAAFVLNTNELIYYMPILLFLGMLSGFIIGLVSNICIKRIPVSNNS